MSSKDQEDAQPMDDTQAATVTLSAAHAAAVKPLGWPAAGYAGRGAFAGRRS